MKKENYMKMTIKSALAVLFVLFAANVVAEAQVVTFPPTGLFPGTFDYVEEVLDNERMRPYIEDYIVVGPNCFVEDTNCRYGPWHPIGFQYHAVNPTTSDGSYSGNEIDNNCVVLAKLWIRERKHANEVVIEVNF